MYSTEDLELHGHPLLCVLWGEDFCGHSAFQHHTASLLQSIFGAKGCNSNSLPLQSGYFAIKIPILARSCVKVVFHTFYNQKILKKNTLSKKIQSTLFEILKQFSRGSVCDPFQSCSFPNYFSSLSTEKVVRECMRYIISKQNFFNPSSDNPDTLIIWHLRGTVPRFVHVLIP